MIADVGESRLCQLAAVVRTWAIRDETPKLGHALAHDRITAVREISPQGERYLAMEEQAFNGGDCDQLL